MYAYLVPISPYKGPFLKVPPRVPNVEHALWSLRSISGPAVSRDLGVSTTAAEAHAKQAIVEAPTSEDRRLALQVLCGLVHPFGTPASAAGRFTSMLLCSVRKARVKPCLGCLGSCRTLDSGQVQSYVV